MMDTRSLLSVGLLALAAVAFVAIPSAAADMPAVLGAAPIEKTLDRARESDAAVLAAGVAQVTGLAISPLLVLVGLGWYDFLRLGGFESGAGTLPLHANPWILFPFTTILAFVALKKFTSPAIPLPLRKVLDAAEYFEAKFSALVAAGLLLPTIVGAMTAVGGAAATGGAVSDPTVTAALGGGPVLTALLAIGAVAIFLCVWITFHAVDALIVLSPFAILDAVLVAIRSAILGLLGVALLVSPFLALVVAIPLIVFSFLVAGWCVRLDLFALVTAGDLLGGRSADPRQPARSFLARRGLGAPIRTMGRAEPTDSGIRFTYRPLFILPERTIEIASPDPVLVRGALWSTLADTPAGRAVLSFPPRYNRAATALAARFRASEREGFLRARWRSLRVAVSSILDGGARDEDRARA
ncbi:MAG: hypothetical protein GC172_02490 [Phycisphaera sp.]|nr:hypothetical protein [Phycisphaera sp.]